MSEKEGLLPKVSEAVKETTIAEFSKAGGTPYTLELIKRLSNENPEIISFIIDYAKKMDERYGQKCFETAINTGIYVYKMLESQAEADNLEKLFENE